jgi:lipoprotein NlpD
MKKGWLAASMITVAAFSLVGCGGGEAYAPVVDGWHQRNASHGDYIVRRGDTLYSIAFSFGLDVETLAQANHLKSPYALYPGQHLRMVATSPAMPEPAAVPAPIVPKPAVIKSVTKRSGTVFWSPHTHHAPVAKRPPVHHTWRHAKPMVHHHYHHTYAHPKWSSVSRSWAWPVHGRVIAGFSLASGGNRGLNIVAPLGTPIRAAASGQVVYSGAGVRGYGNLIILQNARHFLSAYADNRRNLVKIGQWVHIGQKVATMGKNSAGKVMLHFEIRFYGRAVDPMRYLPKR